jgi:hypothetical protein
MKDVDTRAGKYRQQHQTLSDQLQGKYYWSVKFISYFELPLFYMSFKKYGFEFV